MSTETTRDRAGNVARAPRTGPVGRLARLVLATGLGLVAYDLWVDRMGIFAGPLNDPGLWLLTGLVGYGVYEVAALWRWGGRAMAAIGVLAVAAAAVALAVAGTVWAGPLTWLVWGVDITALSFFVVLLLAAARTGTPGCEIGLLRELIRRRRGEADADKPLFCLVGLRELDAWERRMPWHRRR